MAATVVIAGAVLWIVAFSSALMSYGRGWRDAADHLDDLG